MGQAGLEFGNDQLSFGVNYQLQANEKSTAHGVFGTFRYEFQSGAHLKCLTRPAMIQAVHDRKIRAGGLCPL